jgi:hypothetical protein
MEDTLSVVEESGTAFEVNLSNFDNPDFPVGAVIAATSVSKMIARAETIRLRLEVSPKDPRHLLQPILSEKRPTWKNTRNLELRAIL